MTLRIYFKMFSPIDAQQSETRFYRLTSIIEAIMIEKHLHHLWKKHSFCFLFYPKLVNVNNHIGKSLTKWLPLYREEEVLTNSNYIVRKVDTNFTQCVHRFRLRAIKSKCKSEDLIEVKSNNFRPDSITQTVFNQHLLTNHFIELDCLNTPKLDEYIVRRAT